MNKALYLIHLFILLALMSCNPFEKGLITIDIKDEDAGKASARASISNIELVNDELVITGSNLDTINQTKITGNSIDQVLSVISNTGTQLKLSSGSALALVLNSAFDLIFTDAHGSTIVSVTFNVVDGSITTAKIADDQITTAKIADGSVTAAKLSSMSAGVGQVIKYNGTTWVASDLGALTYAGTWDASTATEPNNAPSGGEYYIVTTGDNAVDIGDGAGPRNWAIGDWIIYNSVTTQWDKIDNASYVTSFNSRSGAITPQANDYTWAQIDKSSAPIGDLSDVNVTGAVSGSVLKYDGSNWIVGTDNDTAGSGTSDLGSATNSTINADSDGNGSGSISFQINSSEVGGFANNGNFTVDTNTLVVDASADKVGIGVLAPTYDLSFSGNADKAIGAERHTTADTAGSDFFLYSAGATTGATDKDGGDLYLASGTATGTGSSNIYFGTATAGVSGTADNNPTTKMTILGNGNVGIGSTNPAQKLDVDGNIYVSTGNDICITGGNCLSSVSAGETNLGSNVGSAGVGVFKQKSSATFQFKNINAGSSKVTITDDTANDEIDIDIAEANINHDNLAGFVANEHIDHSSVSIATAATSGLTGGGDLTTTRNLSVNINGTTAETAINSADEVLIYDASATALRKMTWTNFVNGLTPTSRTLTTGDGLTGGGDLSTNRTLSIDLATNPGLEFSSNQLTVKAGTGITLDGSGVNVDVGTGVNQIVQLNGSAQLPALDGSLLTNLSATSATSAELLANTTNAVINADSDSNGSGDIHFQINGTEMGSFENSGDFIVDTDTLVVDASTDRVGVGVLAPTYDLSINGNGNHQIGMERHTTADTAGGDLTINAGGATSVATDKNGGDLVLVSGTATGTGSSNIYFQTATAQGSTNTTDNTPDTKMTILGNGNIGIGTTGPSRKLDVKGALGLEASNSTNDWAVYTHTDNTLRFNYNGAGDDEITVNSSGNIGVGTTSPSGKLDIEGGDVFIGTATLTNSSGNEDLSVSGNLEVDGVLYGDGSGLTGVSASGGASNTADANINADSNGDSTGDIHFQINGSEVGSFNNSGDFVVDTSTLVVDASANSVGIGVLAPTYDLSFGGNATRTIAMERHSTANTAGNDFTLASGGATSGATDKAGGDLYLKSGTATGTGSSNVYIQTATAGSSGTGDNAPSTKMTILGSGNIGIGTSSPSAKLVIDSGSSNNFAIRDNSIENHKTNGNGQIAVNYFGYNGGSTQFRDFHIYDGKQQSIAIFDGSSGNVGIGTTTPSARLVVDGGGGNNIAFRDNSIENHKVNGNGEIAVNYVGYNATNAEFRDFHIYNGKQQSMAIFDGSTSNFGVGTVTPVYPTDVQFSADSGVRIKNTGTSHASLYIDAGATAGGYVRFRQNGAEHFWINSDADGHLLFRPGAGTASVKMLANGNVGIGNSDPTSKFHVTQGSARFNSNNNTVPLVIERNLSSTDQQMSIGVDDGETLFHYLNDEATGAIKFRIQNTDTETGGGANANDNTILTIAGNNQGGRVGIGTGTPSYKLDLQDSDATSNANIATFLTPNSVDDRYTTMKFGKSITTGGAGILGVHHNVASAADSYMWFAMQGDNGDGGVGIVVKKGGRAAVGNTNPQSMVHIGSSTLAGNMTIESPNSTASDINLITQSDGSSGINAATTKGWHFSARGDSYTDVGQRNDLGLWFHNGSGYQIATYIDSLTQNFGIGIGAPDKRLHVYGTGNDPVRIENSSSANWNRLIFEKPNRTWSIGQNNSTYFTICDETAVSCRLYINDSGNVGIGTTSPDEKLVVVGSTTGKYTSSGWTHSSDRRLKKYIEPLDHTLDKILQLEPVSYVFKADEEEVTQVGFIAQDVEPIFPEVVKTDDKGLKSMVYANLVSPLIKAFKEFYGLFISSQEDQDTRILEQGRKIASLEDENTKIKNENAEIKSKNAQITKENQQIKEQLSGLLKAVCEINPNANSCSPN